MGIRGLRTKFWTQTQNLVRYWCVHLTKCTVGGSVFKGA